MKTALCLSGICTKNKPLVNIIYNNIIKPNNADIFIHTWNTSDMVTDLISDYQPKKYTIEPTKQFRNDSIEISDYNINKFFPHYNKYQNPGQELVNNSYSMWYGIHMAILNKEIYALENNIKYDFVIRLRFDVCPNTIIDVSTYENGILYYLNLDQPYDMISDWFGVGDNDIMNIYSNTFYIIEKAYKFLNKEIGLCCNELFLKYQMDLNNIRRQKILSDNVTWGN